MAKVKFTKEFVSAVYGNVYIGKEITVDDDTAEKLVGNGYAEIVKNDAKVKEHDEVEADIVKEKKKGKK